MMTGNIPIPEENVKFIVNDLTPERILRYIDVEDILRVINIEDIIQNLRDEDIQKLRRLLNQKDNGRKNKSRK
jgi:DNA-binding GntR family transcriptional regulator